MLYGETEANPMRGLYGGTEFMPFEGIVKI